jgi:hypothetical protein
MKSYMAYMDKREKQRVVDIADTLAVFSENKGKAKEKYRTFVDAGIAQEESLGVGTSRRRSEAFWNCSREMKNCRNSGG